MDVSDQEEVKIAVKDQAPHFKLSEPSTGMNSYNKRVTIDTSSLTAD
jgi:hypothetical protein